MLRENISTELTARLGRSPIRWARIPIMRRIQGLLSLLCASLMLASPGAAQNAIRIDPPNGALGWLTHPYQARDVPPINLQNSPRLEQLIRAGNLYLTAPDVVALTVENNIDIEVQRYGPLLAREVLKRAQAGGLLRSVGVGVAQGPASVSLTGVSLTSTGTTVTGGNGVSSSGGVLTQLGPAISSFDPTLSFFAN